MPVQKACEEMLSDAKLHTPVSLTIHNASLKLMAKKISFFFSIYHNHINALQ